MPILNGKYKNPGWADGAQPPINAQNLNDISNTLEKPDDNGTGGGKRYASVVVGTSTNGWTKNDCDFLCDGVDDQVEINQAIAALGNKGGEIVVLNGTYHLSARLSLIYNTLFRGCGPKTILMRETENLPGGTPAPFSQWLIGLVNSTFSGFTVDGNKDAFPLGSTDWSKCEVCAYASTISGINFDECADGAVYAAGSMASGITIIHGCYFHECKVGIYNSEAGGIGVYNNEFNFVETAFFGTPYYDARSSPRGTVISGNRGEPTAKIILDAANQFIVTNNVCGGIEILGTDAPSCDNLIIGNRCHTFLDDAPFITLGENTKRNFVTGNSLLNISDTANLIIRDNGSNNVVRFNSDDTGGGGASGVSSFNGRKGAVTPQAGDYTAEMVGAPTIAEMNRAIETAGPVSTLITLNISGWNSKAQTVAVQGILAGEGSQLITPVPSVNSQSAYYDAGIKVTAQAANSLTFTADTVPSKDLSVYVVVQEVS